jgi:hypothetical protein
MRSNHSFLSDLFGLLFRAHKTHSAQPQPSAEPRKHIPYEQHNASMPMPGVRKAFFF